MQKETVRKLITDQFYRSVDESGVKLDAIPHAQLQTVVGALADGVFAVLSQLEEEDQESVGPAQTAGDESVLWSGKPYATMGTRYELTSQRLRIFRGVFSRQLEEIDLVRVRDTEVTQNLGERAFKIGDVKILSSDTSKPEVVLNNVREPFEVREIIRKAYLAEQQRRGLRYRDET
ncbi:MAG: PH domain-containing protein [Vulcanimicrobiota bacterium]